MTQPLFQFRILDNNGNDIDTDDCLFTAKEIEAELRNWNAEPVQLISGIDTFEIDMADGSRGFVRVSCVVE